MGRTPCCDKTKVKRGPWSPEEDSTLKNYLQTHGTGGNWISLPLKAGLKRCGKSCRLRWLNYLRPDIKHGDFTEEEDKIILNLYNRIGSRWSVIASHLQGRTDNDVKNYWNTKMKKKLLAAKSNHTMNNTTIDSNNILSNNSCGGFPYVVDQMTNNYQINDQFPFQENYEVFQENGTSGNSNATTVTLSSSQQLVSVLSSSSSSSQENAVSSHVYPSWANNGGEDYAFLYGSGSGSYPAPATDILNGFDFLEDYTGCSTLHSILEAAKPPQEELYHQSSEI